jgi:phthiocerol/phenolphthiocerol synthesis type-I polyketide synthase E
MSHDLAQAQASAQDAGRNVVRPHAVEPQRTRRPERADAAGAPGDESSEGAPSEAAVRPRPALATPYEAPADTLERAIASIWCETFAVRDVGVDDEFLALGGDSALAARVVARLNRVFGLQLAPAVLLAAPTVRALATSVLEAQLHALDSLGRDDV